MATLEELIQQQLSTEDTTDVVDLPQEKVASANPDKTVAPPVDGGEAIKLAHTLRAIANADIGALLEKGAEAGSGAPENNETAYLGEHTQKQVQPHKGAPAMKPATSGDTGTNEKESNHNGRTQVGANGTGGAQGGKSHAALASNEAAINATKKDKSKIVGPALQAVLKTTPFADPKVKENLPKTKSVDPNIHSKTAGDADADKEMLRQALAAKLAAADATQPTA